MLETLKGFGRPSAANPGYYPAGFVSETVRPAIRVTQARLNAPQLAFVRLAARYPAIVGGYGCLRGETPVMAQGGRSKPIKAIEPLEPVLSWNAEDQRLCMMPSSGSFMKGVAPLLDVVTEEGRFAAHPDHRVLLANGRYCPVSMLAPGLLLRSAVLSDEFVRVISVSPLAQPEPYWDMQVPGTNNYITADGTIHHNSGKTQALIVWILTRKLRYPEQHVAYYMPTYDLIRMIGRPRIIETLEEWGVAYRENKVENRIHIVGAGDIIFRNLDRPERIVGYEVADSAIDELDTLPPPKAQDAWRKIIARNRQKKPSKARNQVAVGTTPEGFRFTYQRWLKTPTPHHAIIHASTYANAHNLPEDYIQSLIDDYPAELLTAYLDGQFVNLAQGRVYTSYDRHRCATDRSEPKPWQYRSGGRLLEAGDELHIGMDFNVRKMAAVVAVPCSTKGKGVDVIGEFADLDDTPAMIRAIQARYPIIDGRDRLEGWPANRIIIYPDASSKNTNSTSASSSDLALLKQAGFRVKVDSENPRIKDRVITVNAAFSRDDDNPRRCRINPHTCPVLVECLENQPYTDKGEPDKSLSYDHMCDAIGYLLWSRVPVARREASHTWLNQSPERAA